MEPSQPTYFASAKRAAATELNRSAELACKSPVIESVLRSVGGLVAVLNEHRQVLTVNDTFLHMLGVDSANAALGFVPGEVLRCEHAQEMPGGCGTSRYCSTCGAAISIVASLTDGISAERKCVMTVARNSGKEDLCFAVRAYPLQLDSQKLVLLFLQDITTQEWRAALERLFFHDINNTLQSLVGMSFMMDYLDDRDLRRSVKPLQLMMSRLAKEVKIEGALSGKDLRDYLPDLQNVAVADIIEEVKCLFHSHPVANSKPLQVKAPAEQLLIKTDPSLLSRIIVNMLKNAFEASDPGEKVVLAVLPENGTLSFIVWNRQYITEPVALRVFQRYFSTKNQSGRGFGTYSMKYFGEVILGGKVDFTTSAEAGTSFRLSLPLGL